MSNRFANLAVEFEHRSGAVWARFAQRIVSAWLMGDRPRTKTLRMHMVGILTQNDEGILIFACRKRKRRPSAGV
jgi:hypothetical protein